MPPFVFLIHRNAVTDFRPVMNKVQRPIDVFAPGLFTGGYRKIIYFGNIFESWYSIVRTHC